MKAGDPYIEVKQDEWNNKILVVNGMETMPYGVYAHEADMAFLEVEFQNLKDATYAFTERASEFVQTLKDAPHIRSLLDEVAGLESKELGKWSARTVNAYGELNVLMSLLSEFSRLKEEIP